MNIQDYKKIVILGAGESGNGAAILAKVKGYDVFVSDYGKIKEQYKIELDKYHIPYEENQHSDNVILEADLVIKSPGIPHNVRIVKAILDKNIPLISEVEWAYHFIDKSKIIAITGSNGKTTTTSLIYHLLKVNNKDVAVVGNIGYSIAKQIAIDPKEWYVLEISSFQLDDIVDFKPNIAILLNITPDHLDRYDYSFEKYALSKLSITKNQSSEDIFIINIDDEAINKYINKDNIQAQLISISMEGHNLNNQNGAMVSDGELQMKLKDEFLGLPINDLPIRGRHNLYNTMAAGISAMAADIRNTALRDSFTSFEGLAHRLEHVATIRGVEFINDSKGTNLNSVWYALESMEKPTILILGGKDKGNDYSEIMDLVKEKVKGIVCMGVDNTKIHEAFEGVVDIIADTLSAKEAVHASYSFAEKGDVVLLSPGCASFDLFENYEDRGDQFKKAVNEL